MNWKNLPYLSENKLNTFIELSLAEDVGDGDHTSLGTIPKGLRNTAELICKDTGIMAGMALAPLIFKKVDKGIVFMPILKDGVSIKPGDRAFEVEGPASSLLTAERLVLNCMQRMSGIASYTYYLNSLIGHTHAKLLDTRKTTPGFRMLEKWAVSIGGGQNHRFGLFDMVLIKDNHVDFAGGISEAIEAIHIYLKQNNLNLNIEIETRNLDEVAQVIKKGGVQRILLDNMSVSDLKMAVEMIGDKFETEASGGITEESIVKIAETGVNYISVGALTHSYRSLDLSLKAKK
jgi:nicotinate-nucleotide pyrophosphorylase (carboxylating)